MVTLGLENMFGTIPASLQKPSKPFFTVANVSRAHDRSSMLTVAAIIAHADGPLWIWVTTGLRVSDSVAGAGSQLALLTAGCRGSLLYGCNATLSSSVGAASVMGAGVDAFLGGEIWSAPRWIGCFSTCHSYCSGAGTLSGNMRTVSAPSPSAPSPFIFK